MQSAEVKIKRWTRDDYYKMASAGLFDDKRVELIDGEIIEVSPMGNPHAIAIILANRALEKCFGPDFCIRCQLPLSISSHSEPEPEFAVVKGDPRDLKQHPSTAPLVVEISASSLTFDGSKKASLYASAAIPDYWIVNLVDRRVEVFRNPVADRAQPFGFRYADVKFFKSGDEIVPLSAAQAIRVIDLLP